MTQPVRKRENDRSPDHLAWLVRNRSANQRVTLQLYTLLVQKADVFEAEVEYAAVAQLLAGAAFSLWRAVFLSDVAEAPEEQMTDAKAFLGGLIANNSIEYPQDRDARGWTFPYYVDDARFRLEKLAQSDANWLDAAALNRAVLSAKEQWELAQQAVEIAVARSQTKLDAIGAAA